MSTVIRASAAILVMLWSSLALAAPKIPAGNLAGRERERFVDPPIARFFQPGGPSEPLLTIQQDCRKSTARKQQRSKRRKGC
jgi:hypothetical protein